MIHCMKLPFAYVDDNSLLHKRVPASSEKYHIADYLKKGTVRNKGEVDSYYMEDNHMQR